jgi:hypothetical protein
LKCEVDYALQFELFSVHIPHIGEFIRLFPDEIVAQALKFDVLLIVKVRAYWNPVFRLQ